MLLKSRPSEAQLTERLLTGMTEAQVEDQGRNFHCWDHHRLLQKMELNSSRYILN